MTNREAAWILSRIADALAIKGENTFKVRAYGKAAEAIHHLTDDIEVLYRSGRLRDIPGVGKSVQAGLIELMEKGHMEYYDRLLEEIPSGVLDMLAIPGLGHKTINIIFEGLGIQNIEGLEAAAREHKIRKLPGLGGKTEYNILKGIEMLHQASERTTLGMALPAAEQLVEYLVNSGAAEEAAVVGSVRRGKPLVGDADILVCASDYESLLQKVRAYPGLKELESCSEDNIKGKLAWDLGFEIIRVPVDAFVAAKLWTTGSKPFREALLPDGSLVPFRGMRSEADIFAHLGMSYIPPEMRENCGEIEAAKDNRLPRLIETKDLRGDLHIHTRWSDGAADIEDMVRASREMGYSYIGITDHSQSLPISGGLSEERLHAQSGTIDAMNDELKDFTILKGVEADILKDGRLDYPPEAIADLDMVIASIHSHFRLEKEVQTERVLTALKDPRVNILGHLTGRLLNRRPGYELDVERILDGAARCKVALEINAHPDRLDIDEETARKAKERGIKIAINSDAHDQNDLKLIRYGVMTARRGWLEPGDVINCWDMSELKAFLSKD